MKHLIDLIRNAPIEALKDEAYVEDLIYKLGIGPPQVPPFVTSSYPPHLKLGEGLKIYQIPKQFAKYLIWLSDKKIKSYVETGLCFGGTFILTIEYLNRFTKLERKVCVETIIWPGENVTEYKNYETFEFYQSNSRSFYFANAIKNYNFDLAFIDGDHSWDGLSSDYYLLRNSRIIAIHDIVESTCTDVNRWWSQHKNETSVEFTDSFPNWPPSMGIGCLIKETSVST